MRLIDGWRTLLPPEIDVFIHMPKSGGVSVRTALHRQYRRSATVWLRDPWEHPDQAEQVKNRLSRHGSDVALVHGHLPFGHEALQGRDVRYFTMLRNPIDRVVSIYQFILGKPGHPRHAHVAPMSLEEFAFDETFADLDNGQTRLLAGGDLVAAGGRQHRDVTKADLQRAARNLDQLAAIGLTSEFDESLAAFSKLLGWTWPPVYAYRNRSIHEIASVDASLRAAIGERNRHDVQLCELARVAYEAQATAIQGSLDRRLLAMRVAQPMYRAASRGVQIARRSPGSK